eukprot:CAMPEP_0174825462 /NCGR_PEP_ID=MMETSP1107-20130205/42783_1 /TAXON_ID=36770 /ORGANISM="Paraphysomonas vestita, Strain GFlagA" /LENGTH=499 /DNA_ID=CAMNT_0016057099 /DNA_START=218 /DNA_END=1717 /DNA_ORIENTATION=-
MPLPPSQKQQPPIKSSPSRSSSTSIRRENPPTPPRKTPPRPPKEIKRSQSIAVPHFDVNVSTIYPGVVKALKLNTLAPGIHDRALVVSKGDAIALNFKDSYRNPHPVKPLWRKREVVKQERTIHYTTIDADGVLQELVERELSQTEVLHMECRETGEFAHRESTDYEHYETFNNELVAETRGNEEYVHLKSLEDEYEYLESNMPNKQPPPQTAEEEEGPQTTSSRYAEADPEIQEGFVEEPEGEETNKSPFGLNPESWTRGSQSSNRFSGYHGEDYDDDGSPPLSSTSRTGTGQKGNLWSSFGGNDGIGSEWIPPPKNHSPPKPDGLDEHEYFNNNNNSNNNNNNNHNNHDRREKDKDYIPAGKRRPDLFSSTPVDDDRFHIPTPDENFYHNNSNNHNNINNQMKSKNKSNQFNDDDYINHNNDNDNDVIVNDEDDYKPINGREKEYDLKRNGSSRGLSNDEVDESYSPFGYINKGSQSNSRRGSREDLKRWGTEDDID